MAHKKDNSPENTPNKETKEASTATNQSTKNSPPASPRKTVNLFMVILLLIIVGGIYIYQKGYVTKYYPLVKTTFSSQNPLDATVDIPQEAPTNSPETLDENDQSTATDSDSEATAPLQGTPSTSSDSYESSLTVDGKTPPAPVDSNTPPAPVENADLKALQERVATLEEKLINLSTAALQSKSDTTAAEQSPFDKTLLFALSNLQDLQNLLHQGLPFIQELSNLKALFSAEDYALLEEYAPIGVPNLPYLIKNFKGVERILKQQEAFKNSTTFLEKSWAFLGQLIHIEKITPADQDTHESIGLSAYKMRLRNGDIGAIITEIEALSNKDETLTLWLSHAKSYEAAHGIIVKTKQSLFQPTL